MATLYAGTSGFAYPAWKPGFYPAKLPANQFLKHYAERLNCVEINYTFRRLPSAATLAELGGGDARRVRLRGEGEQRITHILRLKNAGEATELFFKMIDPLRTCAPPGADAVPIAAADEVRRGAAARLPGTAARRPALRLRVPPPSWLVEEVYDALRQRNMSLCVAESERLEVPEVITADFVYYRLRKPEYTEADVDAIAARSQELLADGPRPVPDVQARGDARRRAECGDGAEAGDVSKHAQTIKHNQANAETAAHKNNETGR